MSRLRARLKDVEAAIKAVKNNLIAKLPKVKRSGRIITKDLCIEVLQPSKRHLSQRHSGHEGVKAAWGTGALGRFRLGRTPTMG